MSENKKNNTAIAALVVSMTSVLLSLFLGWKTIEHNRMSVVPHLDVGIRFIEPDTISNIDRGSGIILDNSGLGPAIIEDVILEWKKENGEIERINDWSGLSKKLNLPHNFVVPFELSSGNAIRANSEIILYKVLFGYESGVALQNSQEKVQVRVKYKSLYGVEKESKLHTNW